MDIDGSLVASHSSSNEDIIMVNNGCICCTVRGDLIKMLLELVNTKRDRFDHIVIETTGILPQYASASAQIYRFHLFFYVHLGKRK